MLEKIRADVRAILAEPAFAEAQATAKGLTVIASDGPALARTIRDEAQIVAAQIKAAGVEPE